MELNRNREEFRKRGIGIAAISYDSVPVLQHFAQRKGIEIPLLSDPDSKLVRQIGILNEQVPAGSPFAGIPHPGTFLLDRHGLITEKYFEDDFRQWYTASAILVRRFGGEPRGAAGEMSGKHLRVKTVASAAAVQTGERIALIVDLELPPGVHVYAPGVEGYIPIAWTLPDSPLYQAHPVAYPEARKMHLQAIGETVPVYVDRVRLVRDITVGRPENSTLTVQGALRYQACDEHKCYVPETLPLRWVLPVEAQDRQRVPGELQRKGK